MKIKYYDSFKPSFEGDIAEEGSIKLYHNGIADGNYAYLGEKIKLVISIPRALGASRVSLIFTDEYLDRVLKSNDAIKIDFDLIYDYYAIEYENEEFGIGLYFYYLVIDGIFCLFSKNENGRLMFSVSNPELPFQLSVVKNNGKESIPQGIMYHIFVDRFFKYGEQKIPHNSVMIENWDSEIPEYPEYPGAFVKNNSFFGGTLYGIKEKLPYLHSMGVSLLYLSPIFESPSNHKYDTANYMKIDDIFGGENALIELIKEGKKYEILIILDGVFNHTGADSIYFNKFARYSNIGAYQSQQSKYYGWYDFESYPDKYNCWWGIDILPKINYDRSDAEEYMLSVIEKWMGYGIFGFRLDVADELSDKFIEKIRSSIKKYNKDGLLYGEVWEDASNKIAYGVRKKYYLGTELDGVMNYPLRSGIIDYIKNKDVRLLSYAINTVMMNMPKNARNRAMNFLGTHDTERILTVFSDVKADGMKNSELLKLRMSPEEYAKAKKRLISAFTLISTLPGIPTVYYGDEAGMEGYSDPFNRRTYPWGREDRELQSHYKKIGEIRKSLEFLSTAEYKEIYLTENLFVFERYCKEFKAVTLFNNSESDFTVSFSRDVTELLSSTRSESFTVRHGRAYIFDLTAMGEVTITIF